MESASSGTDETTLAKLVDWLRDILVSFRYEDGLAKIMPDVDEDLKRQLNPYIKVPEGLKQSSCWPLLKLVRCVPFFALGRELLNICQHWIER